MVPHDKITFQKPTYENMRILEDILHVNYNNWIQKIFFSYVYIMKIIT